MADGAFVGVRAIAPRVEGSTGYHDDKEFHANQADNVVVIDLATKSAYGNSRSTFLAALRARPVSCVGFAAPCTSPTSRPG